MKHLSRKTSGQKFIPEIDGLRFFAIITVLFFHLNTAFSKAIGVGGAYAEGVANPTELGWWIIRMDLGVKVFFAISGFILAIPFINQYWFNGKKVVLKNYLMRRLTRLEPPYIMALIMFYGIHVVILNVPIIEYLPNFLASLFYLHNFFFDRSSVILPIAWSLEVEVQFYLLVPLLALLFFSSKKYLSGFLGVLILFIITIFSKNYIMSHHIKVIGSSILVYFSHFAVGILFSMVYLIKSKLFSVRSIAWDVIGLIGFFGIFYFYKPQASIFNNVTFNASIFTLFVAVFKGKWTNFIFTQPLLYIIGGMCYSIYLIHYPLLLLLTKATKYLAFFESYYANYFLQIIILIPSVLFVSAIYFKLMEQPFMDKYWPQKFNVAFKRRFGKNED